MKLALPHASVILRWAGTLLAAGLLVWLLARQGWDEIGAAFQRISVWRLGLALGLMALSRLAVAMRWHVLLRGAQLDIPFRQSARITFAGLFASNFLPTTIGGDVARLGGILRFGYDRAICLASLVVDRLVGMTGMLLALPGIFVASSRLKVEGSAASFQSLVLSLPLLSSGFVTPVRDRLQRIFRRLFEALGLWRKQPKALLAALACTGIHMSCTFGIVALILDGLAEHVPFGLIGGLWSAAYFITLMPISINGIGVQELSITGLYTQFGGISPESGLVLALLMRVLTMLASLPGVLFVPGLITGNRKEIL